MTDENGTPTHSTTEKTEQIVNEVGARVGMWAGKVVRRMQRTARSFSNEANRTDTPDEEHHEASYGEQHMVSNGEHHTMSAEHPTMKRAEELVDHFGQHVVHWTQGGNMQLRRSIARLREDMEDMWVEAHEVQHHRHENPQQHEPSRSVMQDDMQERPY
ncbi:MAG: hypothetical protein ABI234_00075 [Ktedonobacteraceae bacterium]